MSSKILGAALMATASLLAAGSALADEPGPPIALFETYRTPERPPERTIPERITRETVVRERTLWRPDIERPLVTRRPTADLCCVYDPVSGSTVTESPYGYSFGDTCFGPGLGYTIPGMTVSTVQFRQTCAPCTRAVVREPVPGPPTIEEVLK